MAVLGLLSKLLLRKQITFENGSINILGQPFLMMPSRVISLLFKATPENRKTMYYFCKASGAEFGTALQNNFNLKKDSLRKIGQDIFNIAGWGSLNFYKLDYETNTANVRLFKSTVANQFQSKDPIDHTARGFFAGFATIVFDTDVDCIETSCLATGKDHCEFIVAPSDYLNKNYKKISKVQIER